ncbi:prephenate dehydrogenase [Naasia aerilata]|uniref:Prephenate dehydrogenase n=1 Tax=Naasia aerilata TaxID=1162966 RepID=A0ABM8GGM4_9MICO|nr:prephenate dehydrogenase [Naasia aerilata]BDZ47509.1 prephenate dehydrogenase [Naasia aerilata]
MNARTAGPVLVVGTGLLGASVGLALRAEGVDVLLADVSPTALDLAVDYGAGRLPAPGDEPALVVVAVPPDQIPETVARVLAHHPGALVTDVGSVKQQPLEALRALGADDSRYLGSHPLAGRERGGAISARADLFLARPWVLTPHERTTPAQVRVLEDLVLDLGATPVRLSPEEHDASVAVISHVPQLIASLMAARLVDAPSAAVGIAGQGLRDVTRIAASSPELWVQILGANADAVVPVLEAVGSDLAGLVEALRGQHRPGARRAVAEVLAAGNAGVSRLPGKHGQDARFASLVVLIDDRPGQLAALLTEIGEVGVNLEDLRLEHSPGAQIGIVEVAVLPEVRDRLERELTERGWRIAG